LLFSSLIRTTIADLTVFRASQPLEFEQRLSGAGS
jgi:hypothetical protein